MDEDQTERSPASEHAPAEPAGVSEPTEQPPDAGSPETDGRVDLTKSEAPAAAADGGPATAEAAAGDAVAASRGRLWGRRKHRQPGRPRRKAPWWELPALVVLAILIAIGVKSFVIQPFYIPSESMEHTLYGCAGCSGDRILVNKTIYYFRDPHPGDIVVFNAPKGWDDEPASTPPGNPILRAVRGFGQLIGFVPPDGEVLVKRVIATGGQTVKGDAAGHVMVSDDGPNGHFRTLVEPYVFNDPDPVNTIVPFGPVTIPKGRLWVMGDHRTNSADSRYHCGADPSDSGTTADTDCNAVNSTVPVGNVIGKAIVIAWPPSRWRTLGTPATFESAAAVSPNALPLLTVLPLYALRRRSRRRSRRS